MDVHCHCLPGLDDGPATMADALAVCRALVDDGITTVMATPHQLGPYDGRNAPGEVRAAVAALSAALAAESVPLRVLPGADVRVDDRMSELLDGGRVSTLADGGAFMLLELPHESLVDLTRPIADLLARGITPILTHPERNESLGRRPEPMVPWLAAGMLLQVTAGSLLGQFGPLAERAAWGMVEAGQVSLVATDAHDADHRPPSMTGAIAALSKRVGHAVARRLCIENPMKVLAGDRTGWTARRVPMAATRDPARRRTPWRWFA